MSKDGREQVAWMDDRAWCHPKLVALGDRAFRTYWNGVSYSSGMGLRGLLKPAHQKLVGATPSIRRELVNAELWDSTENGAVRIHDWDDHNSKRDERRARDRERKRAERLRERPQDSPQDVPRDGPKDGSAVKEVTGEELLTQQRQPSEADRGR